MNRSSPRRPVRTLLRPIYRMLKSIYWDYIVPMWWRRVPESRGGPVTNSRYSIAVTTYVNRYETFFKNLINKLVRLFPDTQIIVAVNVYYDREKQLQYLDQVNNFAAQFGNVKLVTWVEPQSLSKLWNQLIIHSLTDKVFILNDDIHIAPSFRKNIERSGILGHPFGLINRSFSHFLISKDILKEIGWFDERFPTLGYEDWDYEARLTIHGHPITSIKISGVRNIVFKTTDFSYGSNMKIILKKYLASNQEFFEKKWEISPEPKPGFVWVDPFQGYGKVREGMETPDFYAT